MKTVADAEALAVEQEQSAESLVGRYGIVDNIVRIDTRGWLPPGTAVCASSCGYPARLPPFNGRGAKSVLGAGRAVDDAQKARTIAIWEAIERYSAIRYSGNSITATGQELGDSALSLADLPRISAAEARRPGCPIHLPDPGAPIRWAPAYETTSGTVRLVPTVVVEHLPVKNPAEKFWLPISTGCAIHQTTSKAILGGLMEVVERDALATAWLRKLPLPLLDPEILDEPARRFREWYRRRGATLHLFDATTDLGIPVVLCVLDIPHHPRISQLVASACGFDVAETATKAMLEAGGIYRLLLDRPRQRRYADHHAVSDNAVVMGAPSRRRAFRFLLDGLDRRPTSKIHSRAFADDASALDDVTATLAAHAMQIYMVDLTPPELAPLGCAAVRVFIPALQPMSLNPFVQYRGHSRLRDPHPAASSRTRMRDLNRWPQPMA
ncbi:YcaO-like family protein [Fodinicola feengrottensis]|uniref:YcaO-like family protein n=1 Tax=Fodinicola feengrottensis TaxID=435914 RepID=UPI0024426C26|nr:YcaO-like family protein [Fodinicola feengrottensis]